MKYHRLQEFAPHHDVPLIISFIEHAKQMGFSSEVSFDFWDFHLHHENSELDDPEISVKIIRNRLSASLIDKILATGGKLKVILVEGDSPDAQNLTSYTPFLLAAGATIFLRDYGWLGLGKKLDLEGSETYKLRRSGNWQRDKRGHWWKRCRKCGVKGGLNDFYPSNYATSRDPYRNQCKECMKTDTRTRKAPPSTPASI